MFNKLKKERDRVKCIKSARFGDYYYRGHIISIENGYVFSYDFDLDMFSFIGKTTEKDYKLAVVKLLNC